MRALLDALHPWPLEEALVRPVASLLLAFFVPIATARAMALVLLGPRSRDAQDVPRKVAPFRTASVLVGIVQLQLAWMLGTRALGPPWIEAPDHALSEGFGLLTVLAALVGGGVGRLVEREHTGVAPARRDVLDAALLRLRLGSYLAGPLVVVHIATRLPILDETGGLRVAVLAAAFALVVIAVAYGGLAGLLLTGSVRVAGSRARSLARRAAEREGVRLAAVLRLPTGTVPFANAAAFPWARTVIVTDRITEILEDDELEAVLAHEAGHLSEPPWVALARIGTAAMVIAGVSLGPAVLWSWGVSADLELAALAVLVVAALCALLGVRSLARRMEERADAHARASVGAEPLARALEKLHHDALLPLVTGKRRVHPDLYDRLRACGRDPGPPPPPPATRSGLVVGLGVAASLAACAWLAAELSRFPASEAELVGEADAWRRLRVDPWDPGATLALAWQARRRDDLERAEAYATEAARLGAPVAPLLEMEAELLAARGLCARARETFDRALAARVADPLEGPLELGGYRIPPTLLTSCGMGTAPAE